ncbi:hypothetical protein [Nocardia asteroides]|uniref:hypothetical protein n=1 Tax=Nocardia asteroides TaxID=1824 RepID=UPI003415F062
MAFDDGRLGCAGWWAGLLSDRGPEDQEAELAGTEDERASAVRCFPRCPARTRYVRAPSRGVDAQADQRCHRQSGLGVRVLLTRNFCDAEITTITPCWPRLMPQQTPLEVRKKLARDEAGR